MINKKIMFLLDDNDEVLLSVIKNKLEKEVGWESVVAQNYDEAISLYEQYQPDALMTEIILNDNTGKTGFDLIFQVRTMEGENKKIPIVVFTDLEQEEDMVRAIELGATKYLIKLKLPSIN